MDVTLTLEDKLVKWYQKRADNFGLDLDDMVDFVLTSYARKTDPKKTTDLTIKDRAASGMSETEARRFVRVPMTRELWEQVTRRASLTETDPEALVSEWIAAALART